MKPDIENTLRAFEEERCSAILRVDDQGVARAAMDAAVRAGFRIVEFTLTIPGAIELVAEFSERAGLCVGAGTVLTREQARCAVDAGARFLVSPVCDPEVIGAASELGVVSIPGTSTPTEMLCAVRAGAPMVKLFPAAEKGPAFVKACLGPLPDLRIVPTSGVTVENARAFLDAGAFALGFVAPLFDSADLTAGDYERIERRGRELRALVARA